MRLEKLAPLTGVVFVILMQVETSLTGAYRWLSRPVETPSKLQQGYGYYHLEGNRKKFDLIAALLQDQVR
ncbi:MAG: hypothetical protein ACXADB_04915 [Candidatus Hermodarchaeia archaeon]